MDESLDWNVMLISKNSFGTYLAGAESSKRDALPEIETGSGEAAAADRIMSYLNTAGRANVPQIVAGAGLTIGLVLMGLELLQKYKQVKVEDVDGTDHYSS